MNRALPTANMAMREATLGLSAGSVVGEGGSDTTPQVCVFAPVSAIATDLQILSGCAFFRGRGEGAGLLGRLALRGLANVLRALRRSQDRAEIGLLLLESCGH
jgi:hypothetical protein